MAYLTLSKSKLIHLATICEASKELLKDIEEKINGDISFINYDLMYSSSLGEACIKLSTEDDYIQIQIVWKCDDIVNSGYSITDISYLNNWYCLSKRNISPTTPRVDILINKECISAYLYY